MNDAFTFYKKKVNKEKKSDKPGSLKRFLYNIFIKTLIVIALFLASLIFIRQSSANKENFKKVVYNNSLSFAKIYSLYKTYLGDVVPFKNTKEDETKVVSNEKITYSKIEKENNGYMLFVSSDYAASAIKSGIVIEEKKNEKYKNIIKVQDENGLNVTYGNLSDVSVKLYDYVEKGEILGNCKDKLYLIFEKDGKYLSYDSYL